MAVTRVLFRVAAGPMTGYGHLVRCRALSRAMGIPCLVSVRGTAAAARTAERLGCVVAPGTPREAFHLRPVLVVIDDPALERARVWLAAARAAGIPVASLHDLGIAVIASDLSIDGSIAPGSGRRARADLHGPRYAVLSPAFARVRSLAAPASSRRQRVLIALGGGARQRVAGRLAAALMGIRPGLDVRVASGFARSRAGIPSQAWLPPQPTLAPELRRSTVAVVGGGVTLYEACSLGVPAVAVGVVPAQQPAIRAFTRAGCAVGAGPAARVSAWGPRDVAVAAGRVLQLVDNGRLRARMARAGRNLVDGRGAQRVAARLQGLIARAEGAPCARRT